jgi:hypothetical protein
MSISVTEDCGDSALYCPFRTAARSNSLLPHMPSMTLGLNRIKPDGIVSSISFPDSNRNRPTI